MDRIKQANGRHLLWMVALSVCLLLGQASSTRAQWTTSGSNIYTNTNNVGIGTNSPNAPLEINKSYNGGTSLIIDNSFTTSGNAAFSGFWFKQGGANRFFFGTINDGNGTQEGGPGAVQFWNFASGPMLFATNHVERMRIDASGNIGFGTSTPNTFQGGFVVLGKALQFRAADHATLAISAMGAGKVPVITLENSDATESKRIITYFYDGTNNVAKFRFQSEQAHGSVTQDNVLVLKNNGNVGIGVSNPQARLHIDGNVIVSGNIEAKYQDVAEWVPTAHALPAGTVVTLHPQRSNYVVASTQAYDTRVAGVVSAQPGLLLGEGGEGKIKVATTGRVKVRVDATRSPVQIGDLLVTSDKEGVAMKSEPVRIGGRQFHSPGTLIGKALEPLESGVGEILVLLSLQ
jgi:hypothetical protein